MFRIVHNEVALFVLFMIDDQHLSVTCGWSGAGLYGTYSMCHSQIPVVGATVCFHNCCQIATITHHIISYFLYIFWQSFIKLIAGHRYFMKNVHFWCHYATTPAVFFNPRSALWAPPNVWAERKHVFKAYVYSLSLNTQSHRPRHSTDVKNVSWILIAKLYVCQGACVSSVHPATHMVFYKSWWAHLPSWTGKSI